MDALAKAVVNALAFLELSTDDEVAPDAAAEAMNRILDQLDRCTPEERSAIESAVMDAYNAANESEAPEEMIDFYENFMDTFFGDESEDEA